MLSSKLSLTVFIILLASSAFSFDNVVNMKECLETSINIDVSHKGKYWGLLKHLLNVKKDKCVIEIKHKRVFTNSWKIDVCRAPVHIKIVDRGVEVIKRIEKCKNIATTNKDDFCNEYSKIRNAILDDGLIFVSGEKEDLASEHGKLYCAYALIEKYLKYGFVMSRHSEFDWSKDPELKSEDEIESCDLKSKEDDKKEPEDDKKNENKDDKKENKKEDNSEKKEVNKPTSNLFN